jgi:hypothetical protein
MLARVAWRFRGSRRAQEWLARARGPLMAASAVSAETEHHFLRLGELIRRLSSASDKLLERSHSLVEIALGKHGGDAALAGSVETLRSSLEAASSSRDITSRLLAGLRESDSHMSGMRGVEYSLRRSMTLLRVVQVLFRTESARLSEEVKAQFLDLSAQVLVLESEIERGFGEKFRTVDQTRVALAGAIARIESEERERSLKAKEAGEAIRRSLAAMATQIELNKTREVDLMSLSHELATEAGRIVMGLQTHDIVSQKLAHIEGALARIDGDLAEEADPGEIFRRMDEFCRVEAGQLGAVAANMRSALEVLRTGAAAITAQVTSEDDDCVLVARFSEATSTTAEMVQSLLTAFADVRAIMEEGAAGGTASREAVRPVSEAVACLNEAITEVAHRIGLVALNAQILAVQKGDGTGLEVLAARTAEAAAETEAQGEQVALSAGQIIGYVQEAETGFERVERCMRDHISTLQRDSGTQEQQLHAMRDSMLSCLLELGEAVDLIRLTAAELCQKAGALEPPIARIEAARAALLDLSGAISQHLDSLSREEGGQSEQAGWLADRYTMSSEREVHAAVLAGSEAALNASEGTGDDVELF